MARIAGITTTKDSKQRLHKITIDVKKHPQAIPALAKLGLIEKHPLQEHADKNGYLSPEELKKAMHQHIDKVWPK